ncbi:MAG: amidohydrolase family protein, partial [Anaerolineae bacterium]
LLGYPPDPRLEGQTLAQLAQEWSQPPSEALMDVILASAGEATVAVFDLNEEDVETAISHPLTMIASDGGPSPGLEHPRLRGTFPRVLSHYVRERGALRLEEAVRKMTSYVAQTFNLSDRGLISPGLRADLVLFDPDTIVDRATYHQPERGPAGIRAVFVAGQPVVRDGELTGRRPGRPVMAG